MKRNISKDDVGDRVGPLIESKSDLVGFLYILMRDHITPGKVERIMEQQIEPCKGEMSRFSNGWLAKYAQDLAGRLG